jgi:hypothetical protein
LILQPLAVSALSYSAPTMNSSVKFFVPRVSVPPLELELELEVEPDAGVPGAPDEDELELELEPHAASTNAETTVSATSTSERRAPGRSGLRGVIAGMYSS